jgi:hypothetical protein
MSNFYFHLVFDNYTSTPRPSDALPASSYSKKMPVDDEFIDYSSSMGSAQDLEELREQLQSMKKQAHVIMEQSRRATERERIALQQAQEAIAAKEAAVTEAKQAASREDFILELLTEASLDMAGELCKLKLFPVVFFFSLTGVISLNRFFCGRCCRRSKGGHKVEFPCQPGARPWLPLLGYP